MVVVMAADHAHEQAKQQEPAEGRKHALRGSPHDKVGSWWGYAAVESRVQFTPRTSRVAVTALPRAPVGDLDAQRRVEVPSSGW